MVNIFLWKIYQPCRYLVVPATRIALGREKLRTSSRHVGCRLHHGWNVDTKPNYAGNLDALLDVRKYFLIKVFWNRAIPSNISWPWFVNYVVPLSQNFGLTLKNSNCTTKWNYLKDKSAKLKVVGWCLFCHSFPHSAKGLISFSRALETLC